MPSPQEILAQLRSVKYPGFSRDIVSFGMIKDIEVAHSGVTVKIAAPTARSEVLADIIAEIKHTVGAMANVPGVEVEVQAQSASAPIARGASKRTVPGVKHVVAVASGKGGVGKSTVAVNLTLAMAAMGLRAGLMDADVYGPSVAMMVGTADGNVALTHDKQLVPIERYGIRYISMAMYVNDQTPVIWRGPMVTKLETEFLFNVEWGELDCLVLDLPPGTGDAQLTITQRVALSGGVLVTTPQEIALLDVRRGATMFAEVGVPVLGVVENFSYQLCRKCGRRHEIFAHGGGARLARELGVPLLAELPIVGDLREGSDRGRPLVAVNPSHPVAGLFRGAAQRILEQLERAPA